MANNPLGSLPVVGTIFGGNAPTINQVPLDAGAQGELNQQAAQVQAGPAAVATADNHGLNQGVQSMQPGNTATLQATAGQGNDAGMVQGLRNAYASQANKSLEALKTQNDYSAQMQYAQYTNQVAKEALGQQQITNQMYDMMSKSYQNQMQARAQMVGSLFGAAGTAYGINAAKGSPSMTSPADAAEWNQASSSAQGMAPPSAGV